MTGKPASSVRSALGWSFVESVLNKGLGLMVKIVLARLLAPEAFGVIGMASVFVIFLSLLSDMGMSAALIQRRESDLSPAHWSTAFTLAMGMAVVGWGLICVLFSPLIAAFYDEPGLKLVLPALGLALVIDMLAITKRIRLRKELKFKQLSMATLAATITASIAAVAMAFFHMGVWALVGKTLIESLVRTAILRIMEPARVPPGFDKRAFMDIFSFSGYMALSRFVMFFTNNLDYILLGKLLGSGALGAYTLAFTLTDTVRRQIMTTFNKVFFPVYSKLQDDRGKSRAYYLKAVRFNSLVIMPLMALLALNADPIILHGFGDKWAATIQPLKLLALSVMVHALGGTAASMIRAAGFVRLMTGITTFLTFLITAPAIAVGAVYGGIEGVAWAVLVSKIIGRNIIQHYVKKLFGIHEMDLFRSAAPAIVSCAGAAVLHYHVLAPLLPEGSRMMACIRVLVEMVFFGFLLAPFFLSLLYPGRSRKIMARFRFGK